MGGHVTQKSRDGVQNVAELFHFTFLTGIFSYEHAFLNKVYGIEISAILVSIARWSALTYLRSHGTAHIISI